MARTRISGFRETTNKAGGLHVQFEPEAADLIREYCRATGQNCKKFINQFVIDTIPRLQKEQAAAGVRVAKGKYGNRQQSAEGTFQPEINAELSHRIAVYCDATDQNRTHYVVHCVEKCLDDDEQALYNSMDKDDLIALVRELQRSVKKQEADKRDQRQLCIL